MENTKALPKIGDTVEIMVNRRDVPLGSVGTVERVEIGRIYHVRFSDGRIGLYAAWQLKVIEKD